MWDFWGEKGRKGETDVHGRSQEIWRGNRTCKMGVKQDMQDGSEVMPHDRMSITINELISVRRASYEQAYTKLS